MPDTQLQTTAERVGKDRVKLRVEVGPDALGPALDAAYRRWAKEIKVPGFRKGKVPRQLIDARVGPDVIREEALRDALPELYREAMRAEELEPLTNPEVEVVEFEPDRPIVFEATVDVRPEFEMPDLATIQIEAPASEVTDDDVNEQLDRLRDRFAELEPVSREARRGDFVLIDLKGYKHDELVEGASAPDYLYEIGSQSGPAKLDSELEGNRPGAILKFTDEVHIHTDDEPEHDHSHMEEISFTVLLKEVKAKKLPALDDEFAKTVGEFDTLDDLKEDVRTRVVEMKSQMAEEQARSQALDAVVEAVDLEPPEGLIEQEFGHRLAHFEEDLRRAGMTIDDYGRQTELTELEIRRDIRDQVRRGVKAELILEQIARDAEIEVTEEDIGQEIALAAMRAGREPKEVAEQVVSSGRLSAVAADVLRRKALDHLYRNVDVLGRPSEEA
ncbi:MAG TPA: trigger factor [Actinomycetota bacterium]|nr:trigger factor [Actinomycetota bacterium]